MPRSIDWVLWVLLLLAVIFEIAGDLAFKWWAETNRWLAFGLGLGVYMLSLTIFAVLLRRGELSVIFSLWVGLATLILAVAGWWLFDEALSFRQILGIFLVASGVLLLGWKS